MPWTVTRQSQWPEGTPVVEMEAVGDRVRLCFSVLRYYPITFRDRLRREGLWEDLGEELRIAAWEAERKELGAHNTCLLAGRRIRAFLKANGYHRIRHDGHRSYVKDMFFSATTEGSDRPLEERLADASVNPEILFDLDDCPPGVIRIAHKLVQGDPLTPGQKVQLDRFRRNGKLKTNWGRESYYRRRAQGLCVSCGQKADGHARCPQCLGKIRAYQSLYKKRKGLAWQAKLREHWRKEGRCTRCGRAPEPGRKKCSHCLAVDRESLKRWKQKNPGAWAAWHALHREEYNAKRRKKPRPGVADATG